MALEPQFFPERTWRKKDIPPSVTREPRSMPRKISPKRRTYRFETRARDSAPLRSARSGSARQIHKRKVAFSRGSLRDEPTDEMACRSRALVRAAREATRPQASRVRGTRGLASSPATRARVDPTGQGHTRARAWRRKPRWARSASSPRARWSAPGAASARACTCSATSSSARGACSARTRWWVRRYVARDASRRKPRRARRHTTRVRED